MMAKISPAFNKGFWCLTVLCLLAGLIHGQGDLQNCPNDHFQWDSSRQMCVCNNELGGGWGWTGRQNGVPSCEIRNWGAGVEASESGWDLTAGCSDGGCNHIEAGNWQCFSLTFAWRSLEWGWGKDFDYFAVQLKTTGGDPGADPDVKVMFNSVAWSLEEERYPSRDYMTRWDFSEDSDQRYKTVVKRISKASFGRAQNYTGAYLCVYAFGLAAVDFSLKAHISKCPNSFDKDGHPLVCSTRDQASQEHVHGTCNAENFQCDCMPQYQGPDGIPPESTGLAECASRVTNLTDSLWDASSIYTREHEEVPASFSKEEPVMDFWAFNVTDDHYEVEVSIIIESTESCSSSFMVNAYLQYASPPSRMSYDAMRDYSMNSDDDAIILTLNQGMGIWRAGPWYAGVISAGNASCLYSLSVSKFQCPKGCSGHGSCDATRHVCTCEPEFGRADCSARKLPLTWNQALETPVTAEYQYYSLPADVGSAVGVDVIITASWQDNEIRYSTFYPELLVMKVGAADSWPTTESEQLDYKLIMPVPGRDYKLTMTTRAETSWHVAIYNPRPGSTLSLSLTVQREATCLNGCSGRGDCSSDTGICTCHEPARFKGLDCGVDLNDFAPSDTSCTAATNTRRGWHLPDEGATCWDDCVCDANNANCQWSNNCAAFECDDASKRPVPFSQSGHHICVQDECHTDEWIEEDRHVCVKRCHKDANPGYGATSGWEWKLDAQCVSEHFVCKPGFRRFSDGSLRCYSTGTCIQGTLQESALVETVPNGKAYAICLCSSVEDENEPRCSYDHKNEKTAKSVVCNAGYSVQNATKLPHLDMWVGGHCSLAASSVQAGYTTLQVCMIAAAVGVGAVFLTGLAAWRKMLSTKSENLGGSQYGIDMMAFGSDEHSFGPSKTLLPKRLQLDSMEEDL